ncbi:hypothetical protein CYMTET_40655 [Cymbomonas tetramitiformis]|uniref:Uncharacterized protein n=1 Tax=Cymbomonas tetramitiformis TaxID=36881 RepID=A0AAE0F3E8_9CHLO|nr:hypothetical protein CYMTET_40655 [Cymbomonas tetramitiformis]
MSVYCNAKKVNASVDNVDKGVTKVIDLIGQVLNRQDKHLALAEKQNKVADAMLQNLIKLNSSAGIPTPPTTGTGRRKRGALDTPTSDTGEDTDMDREAVQAEIETLKKLRKVSSTSRPTREARTQLKVSESAEVKTELSSGGKVESTRKAHRRRRDVAKRRGKEGPVTAHPAQEEHGRQKIERKGGHDPRLLQPAFPVFSSEATIKQGVYKYQGYSK